VLDIGCGGGFLSNELARAGHAVTGVDRSEGSLEVARRHDTTKSVQYQAGDALQLPFADETFDVACAMDFLEHVEAPDQVIAEAARVLKPNGLFFFHTFNRTLRSRLLVIQAVEKFIPGTPKNLHVHRLFIKPVELREYCRAEGLAVEEIRGIAPVIFTRSVLRGLARGSVPEDFRFRFTNSLATGYCGFARKRAPSS